MSVETPGIVSSLVYILIPLISGAVNSLATDHIINGYYDSKSVPDAKERHLIMGGFGALMGILLVVLRKVALNEKGLAYRVESADVFIIIIYTLVFSVILDYLNQKFDVY